MSSATEESSSPQETKTSVVSTLCCPFQCMRRSASRRDAPPPSSPDAAPPDSRRSIYHDASDGLEGTSSMNWTSICDEDFFDARQSYEDLYPVTPTKSIPPRHRVSMLEPESLLRSHDAASALPSITEDEAGAKPSRKSAFRRSSMVIRHALEKPKIKVDESGFPGELTTEELEACQRFRRQLTSSCNNEACGEIVYSLQEVEKEPYALCRFMRATKFDVDQMLERLSKSVHSWLDAKQHDFYPDEDVALGVPLSVFLTQYPYLYYGNAKNGSPVSYLKAGRIDPEGILCMTTVDSCEGYFWHQFMYKLKENLAKAQATNPDIVRCEGMTVMDLTGLSTSQMTSDCMEVIKRLGKIGDFFPETLHCMLILNAPRFFSMSWKLIKRLIDPRTAKRIEVYSSPKGTKRLLELVDKEQVPSDFGGSAPSTASTVQKQRGLLGTGRQVVKLMYVKKQGKAMQNVELAQNEEVSIRVYTRSANDAKFSVSNNSELIKEVEVSASTSPDGESFLPSCTEIASGIKGPGKVTVTGMDIGAKGEPKSGCSTGYYLLVVDVNKV